MQAKCHKIHLRKILVIRHKFLESDKLSSLRVVLGRRFDVVKGNWRPIFPVIIELPSLEEAHRWYSSEEYRELKELRLSAVKSNAVFIEGI
jgi:uncharacterized protein (DUF1330 family)